jgi:hypothetical protein
LVLNIASGTLLIENVKLKIEKEVPISDFGWKKEKLN